MSVTTSTSNVAVSRRFAAAFNARDFAGLDDVLAADIVDHHLPPGLPAGRAGVEQWLQLLAGALDIHVEIHETVAERDQVAIRATVRGTHVGEFNGIPATGRNFNVPMQSMERFENGRIAERWESIDNAAVLQQLGVI